MPPMKELVDAATSESAVGEDWGAFLDICQLADTLGTQGARECVLAISKRLTHKNPNVALLSIALCQGLVKNCGHHVHCEISSRQFTQVLVKVLNHPDTHSQVKTNILALIHQCVRVFDNDPLLGYMADVQAQLSAQGFTFQTEVARKVDVDMKKKSEFDLQKEQEDLELAIALSLSETDYRPPENGNDQTKPQDLQPTLPMPVPTNMIKFHVRALYDFAGTDRGELSFKAGDVIGIVDADYDDWWEGQLRNKSGLVPSNYVEKLPGSAVPTPVNTSARNGVSSPASLDSVLAQKEHVDSFFALLSNLNPHTQSPLDDPRIQAGYRQLVDLRPALVAQLTAVRARRDRLLATNEQISQSRTIYNHLLDAAIRSNTPQYLPPVTDHRHYNAQHNMWPPQSANTIQQHGPTNLQHSQFSADPYSYPSHAPPQLPN